MTFIPTSTQLLRAVKANNISKAETLILNSDTKRELILNHISINGEKNLLTLLPHFKSKGLVLNIKNLLDLD